MDQQMFHASRRSFLHLFFCPMPFKLLLDTSASHCAFTLIVCSNSTNITNDTKKSSTLKKKPTFHVPVLASSHKTSQKEKPKDRNHVEGYIDIRQ